VRLNRATGTRVSKPGDTIEATLISPVYSDGRLVLAPGATLQGNITIVKKLGFGIKRSTASLGYLFHTLELEDGQAFPVMTRLVSIETAKERVSAEGLVHGIRPTANVSSTLAFYAWRLALIEPWVAAPVWATKFAFAPSPDPEINFPAGTELVLELTSPLVIPTSTAASKPAVRALSTADQLEARRLAEALSKQHTSHPSGKRSDIFNVMFMGSREQVEKAFRAAGWTGADRRSLWTLIRTYDSVIQRKAYTTAPMARLEFEGRPPDTSYQKGLNTFAKRHHLRMWRNPAAGGPESVWVAAATEDTGYRFSWKKMHWTHESDLRVDNERAKVVNDLVFTGCVDGAGLVDRILDYPDSRWTDGRLAVLKLNDCESPRRSPAPPQNRRTLSAFFKSFGNDIIRSNAIFLGTQTTQLVTATKSLFVGPTVKPARSEAIPPPDRMEALLGGSSWESNPPAPLGGAQ